jgi:hypothetical protein
MFVRFWRSCKTSSMRWLAREGLRTLGTAAFLVIAGVACGEPANTQTISVEPGKNTDVYFEINLAGKVFLVIYAPAGGEACADFWWIKWPLGNTQSLGRHCGSASFDIPGVFDLAISAKLRVGGARQPLKLVAAANEQVAHSATVNFP